MGRCEGVVMAEWWWEEWYEEEVDVSEVKVSFQFRHGFLLTSSRRRQKPTSGEWRGLVGLILSTPQ